MLRHMLLSLPRVDGQLLDRHLLRAIAPLVPSADRAEWSHSWQAELWHLRHPRSGNRGPGFGRMADITVGLLCDALWLRAESWRCLLAGTAVLCLGSLAACSLLGTLLFTLSGLALAGGRQALFAWLQGPLCRCAASVPLILFVSLATAPRWRMEPGELPRIVLRLKRCLFFLAKISQAFLLSFLVSVAVCAPLHEYLPHTADLYQMFGFVLLSLLGLRWALRDQGQRCKQCLQSLAAPARVGRPSHNLLEWNGSELSCKHGHGLLSVPEIETSWCQSSHWVARRAGWDAPMSV